MSPDENIPFRIEIAVEAAGGKGLERSSGSEEGASSFIQIGPGHRMPMDAGDGPRAAHDLARLSEEQSRRSSAIFRAAHPPFPGGVPQLRIGNSLDPGPADVDEDRGARCLERLRRVVGDQSLESTNAVLYTSSTHLVQEAFVPTREDVDGKASISAAPGRRLIRRRRIHARGSSPLRRMSRMRSSFAPGTASSSESRA
jgi:hypothetical protein